MDNPREHVLVALPAANAVAILTCSGHLVTTINNVYGAQGMVLGDRYAWIVEHTAGAVVRIDLTSPNPTPVTIASGLVNPNWIALTGGRLWVGLSGGSWGSLASINPSTGVVTQYPTSYYDPDLATSPGVPSTLFVAEDALSPGSVYRLSVASGKPVQVAADTATPQENIQNLIVSPDGSRVIPAGGAPYYFAELYGSNLQPDGLEYPGQPYPDAVAVAGASANEFAGGLDGSYSTPDVYVDHFGTPVSYSTATTTDSLGYHNVPPHGLALSASGKELAVAFPDSGTGHTLLGLIPVP